MPAHYGVEIIPDAHKNAINVLFGLVLGFNPTTMECFGQPTNTTGNQNDPFTHWYGGQEYSITDVAKLQQIIASIPGGVTWPVQGATASVSLAQAQAAAAALVLVVTTRDTYTSQQATDTLNAALDSQGLKRINWDE